MAKLIHVAVGVVVGVDGKILIAKRPQTAHQGGLWEFPGGKVDAGESIHQALDRELMEELGISVTTCEPLIQIRHHYPDKSVLLDVYKVTGFTGEPYGAEGQPICWVQPNKLIKFDFPAANKPIISAISLPDRYLVTGEFTDEDDLLNRLVTAFNHGIRIAQLRIQTIDFSNHQNLLAKVITLAEKHSATLLINSDIPTFEKILVRFPFAKMGLHLNRHQAAGIFARPIPAGYLLGTSCHDEGEIAHGQRIGADYLLLSPVKATSSHPNVTPMGWNQFEKLVELANIPVYALGGVADNDLKKAKSVGAQGIAGISAWW